MKDMKGLKQNFASFVVIFRFLLCLKGMTAI